METEYEKLISGKLAGSRKLQINSGLTDFPAEIFSLSDSLEELDLSGNKLKSLPDDFCRLEKLKILFLSQNCFRSIPKVLSKCSELTMIGFKSNSIVDFPENSMPKKLKWLILTDNNIEKLPDSMRELSKLKKLMLAGNKISNLPDSMAECRNLELTRLSANDLTELPDWLFEMPKVYFQDT